MGQTGYKVNLVVQGILTVIRDHYASQVVRYSVRARVRFFYLENNALVTRGMFCLVLGRIEGYGRISDGIIRASPARRLFLGSSHSGWF